jgi:hypothetical protein
MMQTRLPTPSSGGGKGRRSRQRSVAPDDYYEGGISGFIRIVKPFMTNELSGKPLIEKLRQRGCSHPEAGPQTCRGQIFYCHYVGSEQ